MLLLRSSPLLPIPQAARSPPATLSPLSVQFFPEAHFAKLDSPSGEFGFRSTSKRAFMNRGRPLGVRCEAWDDGFYMRRCVELARRAVGCTSPNPMVGCVIVKGGQIVGEGFHPKAGQPHAEVFALKDAGVLAENATAYVSLEPCNHFGRTPPCTEALIHAKVKRVVVGMVDPNPIVASKGVERLRETGIDVIVGVEETLCRKLNEAYIHRMFTGKPFVTLRYSLSINGRILNNLGKGAEGAGGYYSQLLQEYDGIVICSESLERSSSLPRSCETGANQPLRIVISRDSGYPSCLLNLPTESSGEVIILAKKGITVEVKGIETVVLEKMNLSSVLDYCATRGLCNILLDLTSDSGALSELLQNALEEQLVHKVVMEACPIWDTSDASSILAFGKKSFQLKDVKSRTFDESIVVEGYFS